MSFINVVTGGTLDDVTLTGYTKHSYSAKTSSFVATSDNQISICDCTSGAITITLPAASDVLGMILTAKKIDSSVNALILDGNASETIDGATTFSMATQYMSVSIFAGAAGAWYKI